MKKLIILLTILVNAPSAFAACATASATVTVVDGLRITKTAGLNFGYIRPSSSAECVSPNDPRGRAEFRVTGNPNSHVLINLPEKATLYFEKKKRTAQSQEIAIETLRASAFDVTLDASGSASIYVGGCRAQAAPNQKPGYYADDLNLTAVYIKKNTQDSIADWLPQMDLQARIMKTLPIALTNFQSLEFGKISADYGGNVSISTTGVRSAAGGVNLITEGSVSVQATFNVSGLNSASYSIALPSDGTVFLSNGGGDTMSVNSFVSDPDNSGFLGASGVQMVNVGAALSVAHGQAPGAYTGTFDICTEYH